MSFILVDRLQLLDTTQAIAEKVFREDDPVFRDHFPGGGIVPGSLILEAMAQTCGWWISARSRFSRKSALLLADSVQFRRFVKPGECIQLRGNMIQEGEGRARFDCRATVDGRVVARAQLSFAVFAVDDPSGPFRVEAIRRWMEEKYALLGGPDAEVAD